MKNKTDAIKPVFKKIIFIAVIFNKGTAKTAVLRVLQGDVAYFDLVMYITFCTFEK
ncbi:MAG: hypothetical protein KGZ82_09735 [Bacteroidales bacterium]|nr:hypothetical protein [Bacteroidales bacterium]